MNKKKITIFIKRDSVYSAKCKCKTWNFSTRIYFLSFCEKTQFSWLPFCLLSFHYCLTNNDGSSNIQSNPISYLIMFFFLFIYFRALNDWMMMQSVCSNNVYWSIDWFCLSTKKMINKLMNNVRVCPHTHTHTEWLTKVQVSYLLHFLHGKTTKSNRIFLELKKFQ